MHLYNHRRKPTLDFIEINRGFPTMLYNEKHNFNALALHYIGKVLRLFAVNISTMNCTNKANV